MSFDRLAPHYHWMERMLAGGKLQRCRIAWLPELPPPRRALLLGEGHGRFLPELLRRHPDTEVTLVDASAGMLAQAASVLSRTGLDQRRVRFVHADVLAWQPDLAYDLVASHFFLDCFAPHQIASICSRVGEGLARPARWLISDFCAPPSGWRRWRARCILGLMYAFFRPATGLTASAWTAPDTFLQEQGFLLEKRRVFEWGLLHSDLWVRP